MKGVRCRAPNDNQRDHPGETRPCMTRLPQVTARQMLAVLERAGFVIRRSRGSHHYLVHQGDPTRRTTVAMHSGDLSMRDVRDILKQAKLSRDDFLKLL